MTSSRTSLLSTLSTTPIVKVSVAFPLAPQYSWPKYWPPPPSMLFTFEEFAAAVALAHPLPGPVASALVSPSPSYTLLSGITSPSSLPTELSLPASWAEWSPSLIDYEGISEWAKEAAEADPPAPPLFAVFPQVPEGPAAPFILENPAPVTELAPVAALEVPAAPPLSSASWP